MVTDHHADSIGSSKADHFHDECGVVGVWGHPEAANLAYLGLHALQHRGQEGAGIVTSDGSRLHVHRGRGLVADVFGRRENLDPLEGHIAVGHVRYSTAGESDLRNVQPILVQTGGMGLAVAHNGNFVNARSLREELESRGAIFQATSDTELLVHLVARSSQRSVVNKVVDALSQVKGAWSVVFMTPDGLIAARDPLGFRPLVLGRHPEGAWIVASESCALDLVDAELVRDIDPGEVVVLDRSGAESFRPFPRVEKRQCIFEHLYFSRPDTHLWGQDVYQVRRRLGRTLAKERPADADLVIPVPDSGVASAMGYAEELELPFHLGLVRNHYVGRSFIEPTQQIRDFGVKLKLNPVRGLLADKRVVVVDDSLVRGTTCRKIVRMLRRSGAAEVHLRIAAPPTIGPCFYGIDTPSRAELIAANNEIDEIGRFVGADSIGYITVDGMHEAVNEGAGGFCDACFSGQYPVLHEDLERLPQLPLFLGG
ncbi:MAG TPA: amidophosphoribosyltransferase [Deltaproteobacteria bacterium]|nr:amidophosphoribosyltransferase [Deltaproteobacteria bacterium]HCP46382.1 amidophosphoribosyltransferase [Deltaproteobacteria bacterium]